MGSASVANQALSYRHCGALSCNRSGTESTSTSSSRRVVLRRSGLFALPSRERTKARHHGQKRPSVRPAAVAAAFHTLLDSSTSIEIEGLVAEAPTLLALSSDFDWQKSAIELREEALGACSAHGQRDMVLEQLEDLMHGWLHDGMLESVLQPALLSGVQTPEEELSLRIRVEELRSQATLQAAEKLARGVDSSFDWETEVAELHQTLRRQQHVEFEQQMWQSWESAREEMGEEANRLHEEALNGQHMNEQCMTFSSNNSKGEQSEHQNSLDWVLEKSGRWMTLGAVLAGWFGGQAMDAIAADEPGPMAITEAVTKVAPGWVAPSVLAFPVASYLLFNVYREKVNPYAKVTDWMFGLVAMAIVGNIVLIATVGVRLY